MFPFVTFGNLIFAAVVILLVGVLSTAYPARMATRIQPAVAMSPKE